MIELIQVHNPLDRSDQTRRFMTVEPGCTLQDVVEQATANLPVIRNTSLAVSVDGSVFPREQWGQITLIPEQQVTIIPVMHGGGGGKDIFRAIAMIIVAVVATIASFYVQGLAASLPKLWAQALGGIVAGGVMMAGAMIVNAIIPPTTPQLPALGGYNALDQSNSYSWSPQTTQQQGTVIPVPYGLCKLTGNIISVNRESLGDKQYLNILISLGTGPLADIFDVMLNDQPISNYDGVELHTRLGHLNQEPIPFFNDTKREYALGLKVVSTPSSTDGAVLYTTVSNDFNGIEVELTFPYGLFYVDDHGNMVAHPLQYSIEISPAGTNTWTSITNSAASTLNTAYNGRWSAGKWVWSGGLWGSFSWREIAVGSTYYADHVDGEQYADNDLATIWRWWPAEVTTVTGNLIPRITATAAQRSVIRHVWRSDNLAAGRYDIRVTKWTADFTDSRYGDDLYLTAVREIIYDDFEYPCEALVGIRGLATEKLSGSFSFSCKTNGKLVRIYRDGAWYTEASSSPAWVAHDILTQPIFDNDGTPLKYLAYDPSGLNLTHYRELADYNADQVPDGKGGTEDRLTWNGQFDSQQTMWDAALSVLASGRATPYWRGNIICLAIDKPAATSTTFSVGNILKDSFKEHWLKMEGRANRVEVDFLNRANNLERDKMTVVNHAAPAHWGTARLPLQGCIKPSEVIRRCRYHLNSTLYLTRSAELTCDVDALPVTMGSVVNVQHDVMMVGVGGRINSATTGTVVLDHLVTIDPEQSYMIDMVTPTGMISRNMINHDTATLANGDTVTRIYVDVPLDPVPVPYTVFAFGPPEKMSKQWRVVGISPAGDLKQEFALAEYNDTIHNSDYDEPVLPTPTNSAAELPRILPELSERMINDLAGLRTMLDISWAPVTHPLARSIEIHYRTAGQWQLLNRVDSHTTGISMQVLDGQQYQVVCRVLDWFGNGIPVASCVPVTTTIIGKTARPADVTGLTATTTTSGALRLDWLPVPDLDIDHYEVVVSVSSRWSNSLSVTKAYSSSLTLPAAISGTYMVKAVDTSGNKSVNAASVVVAMPSDSYRAQQNLAESTAYPGLKVGCNVVAGKLELDVAGQWDGSQAVGYYYASQAIDLGSVQPARCLCSLDFLGIDTQTTWDDVVDVDAVPDVDAIGTIGNAEGCELQPQIAISQNGSNWGDWQPFTIGDYPARAFKFRLKLISTVITSYPQVSALQFKLLLPYRNQIMPDVVLPATATTIALTPAFVNKPVIKPNIQNAQSGDTVAITGVTTEQFTIQVLNGGAGVVRTVDIEATGT